MTTSTEVKAPFHFAEIRPQLLDEGKYGVPLFKGQVMRGGIQIIANGGENNLHNHPGNEAVWIVMNGSAKFYTTNDELVAEVCKNETLFIPAGAPYWFESSSPENLVILRIGATVAEDDQRIDLTERPANMKPVEGSEKRKAIFKEGVYFGD